MRDDKLEYEPVGVEESKSQPIFEDFKKATSNAKGYPYVEICAEKLYVDLFGVIPSAYYVNFDSDSDSLVIDFESISVEQIKSAYVSADSNKKGTVYKDVEVITRFTRTSGSENVRGKKVRETKRRGAYVNDRYVNSQFIIIDNTNRFIAMVDDGSMEIYFNPTRTDVDYEKICDSFWASIPKVPAKKKTNTQISLITVHNGGLDTVDSEINETTIDVKKTYNDDFEPVYENIKDFINSDERTCGIVILNGEPGTGKTTLIRDLITHSEKKFLFIPPALSTNISSPEFVHLMLDNANSVFIMEDCEKAIEKRSEGGYLSSVASILNMSDGLLGDIYNIKFICTFNSDLSRVDPALLRKGRCVARYTFNKLDKEKTKVLLNERGIFQDEYKDMSLADIFHYGEDTGVETKEKRKIGF